MVALHGGGSNKYRLFVYNATTSSNIGSEDGSGFTFSANGTDTIRFQIIIYNNYNAQNLIFYPMLVSGAEAKPYEQYTGGYASPSPNWEQPIQCVTGEQSIVESDGNNNSITYPISLGSKQLYEDCYIVGSPDNWKFVDNYYKEKFNQTTIERTTTNTNNKYRFKIAPTQQAKSPSSASEVADILSNIATKESANATYSCENGIAISSTGSIFIYQEDFSAYTGGQMRSYFANNDDYIVYPLATPIETPITDTTLIEQLNNWYYSQSFNGTTIIESNGDLPMIIKVRALKGE